MSDDPFTQAYDRIWTLLEAQSAFTDIVKLGNRTNLSGSDSDPIKDTVQGADTPEVWLHQGAFVLDAYGPASTNLQAVFSQTYPLITTHRDLRVDLVNQLKWETFRALAKGGPHLGLVDTSAQDVGQFCDGWQLQDSRDQLDNQQNRGRRRFVTLISIQVNLRWPIAALTS